MRENSGIRKAPAVDRSLKPSSVFLLEAALILSQGPLDAAFLLSCYVYLLLGN